MKTMEKLVQRFNRKFRDWYYEARFEKLESYPGYYRVIAVGPFGVTAYYTFKTCREFREWMDGVVLE